MSQFTVEVFPDTSTIEVTTQAEYQVEVNNLAVPVIPVETITSISFDNNTLTYIDENGASTNLDLSAYLDDTNLARLIEGSLDENGTATFTRDDGTSFTVDYSPFFDNTNLARVDEASFNTSDGVLTLTRDDDTTITASFDGRYLRSETNDLSQIVTWADVPDVNITQSSVTQHEAALTITEGQISDLKDYLTAETVTSLNLDANTLSYTDESGNTTNIDLSLYLDDTNLARLIEGTLDESGIATFTRDDDTTFTVDFSPLFDDTNLARVTSATFNTSDGVLTLTRDDNTTVTASLDGRYLQNITAENLQDLANVEDTAPGAAQDGFVLTWDNTTSQWKAVEAGSPHSYITWSTSGSESQFRVSELFYDDDDSPNTIRTVSIVNNKLQIELATFSPNLSASGQSRSWDQPATQFTVSVDNPSDITNQWISALALIDNATGVSTNVAGYSTTGPSATPGAGVDWNQTFNPSGSATIYSNGTGLSGGSASARLTFEDNFGANYTETRPTISYSWSTANVTLNFSNLSGNNFLQFYSSVGYNVNVTGISDANNYSHSITGVGGNLSNNAGSGSMTFTTGLHKNNNSGRSVSTVTTFSRPAGVTGTAYNVNDTASDSTISASFTYPSFYIWTGNTATSPTRADIVTGYDFDTEVTELGNQTRVLSAYINNTEATPRAFWFGVRSNASQPSTFQTGSSPSLLSDVSAVTQTVALEPDSPLSGYVAENYTLYGITLQPGSTYVSIS